MSTSSANPDKLDSYSTDGLDLIGTLRTKSNAVSDALEALRASGSPHVPALGDVDATLRDVVDDWYHLDEFVGDVAQGFFEADHRGGVITVDDGTLVALGQIGYADRDEAIAAANEMADELERLQDEGATAGEIDAFVEMAARGQYDPAFAVTFSERVGADGYADATAMIRAAYFGSTEEGTNGPIPNVQVLSTLLTTALDTRAGIAASDRHDPSNADLPYDQRLSDDFVDDLIGYEADGSSGGWWSGVAPDDFSVLIGLSDPPTDVAVAIADNHMRPLLANDELILEHNSWWASEGYGDPVVNYATMLGRNEDASATWLSGEGNLELVLDHPGEERLDGGASLAGVVEAGLANSDLREPVPGAPSYVEGGLVSEELMNRAINHIGSQNGDYDVPNEHLYGALASGVESNMTVIDDRVNGGWSLDSDDNYQYGGGDELANTMYFLGDVMADDDAANRIRSATFDHVDGELAGLTPEDDGLLPRDDVQDSGRLLGTVMESELMAITEGHEEDQDRAAQQQKRIDFATGWVPYLGEANAIVDFATDTSAGKQLISSPDGEQFKRELNEAEAGMGDSIDGIDLSGRDMDALKTGVFDVGSELASQQAQPDG